MVDDVAIVAIVWNLLGLMAFVMQVTMSAEALEQLPTEQQELFDVMPGWVTIAFGVAVICGVLGSLALVLRKKWALPILILSLVGILAQNAYMFFLSETITVMGAASAVFPIIVTVIAVGLVALAQIGSSKNWLS